MLPGEGHQPEKQESGLHFQVCPYFTEWPQAHCVFSLGFRLSSMKCRFDPEMTSLALPFLMPRRSFSLLSWVYWLPNTPAGEIFLQWERRCCPGMTLNGRCLAFLLFFGPFQEEWNEKTTEWASCPGHFLIVMCLPSLFPCLCHLPRLHSPLQNVRQYPLHWSSTTPLKTRMQRTRHLDKILEIQHKLKLKCSYYLGTREDQGTVSNFWQSITEPYSA